VRVVVKPSLVPSQLCHAVHAPRGVADLLLEGEGLVGVSIGGVEGVDVHVGIGADLGVGLATARAGERLARVFRRVSLRFRHVRGEPVELSLAQTRVPGIPTTPRGIACLVTVLRLLPLPGPAPSLASQSAKWERYVERETNGTCLSFLLGRVLSPGVFRLLLPGCGHNFAGVLLLLFLLLRGFV
jgi:hypothetical protein